MSEAEQKTDPLKRAREAMLALTPEERAQIHAEVGCCTCAATSKVLVENPSVGVGVGAAVGGLLGALRGAE